MTTITNLGTSGTALDATSTGPLLLDHTGTNHLYLPGVFGNYVAFPDAPELRITGDIEVVVRATKADATVANRYMIAKYGATAGIFSWAFQFFGPTLYFTWATDGVIGTATNVGSDISALTDGVVYWWKSTLNTTTGKCSLYYAADAAAEPGSWTTLTTAAGAGATSVYSSPALVTIGSAAGAGPLTGDVYRAIIRDGIGGTTVFDVDFTTGIVTGNERTVPVTVTTPTLVGAQAIENLGSGGTVLDAICGSSVVADTNDPLFWEHDGSVNYMGCPGAVGNGITLADVALGLDMEIVFRMDHTAPWVGGVNDQTIIGKTNSSYEFYLTIENTGQLKLIYSLDGTTPIVATSPVLASAPEWGKVTRNGTTGAILFYTATGDGTNTPPTFGAALTTSGTETAGALYNGPALVTIGAVLNDCSAGAFNGKIYRAILKDGIGGAALIDVNIDADGATGASTSFTASTGGTATIVRSTSGRKLALVDRNVWLLGTDDYFEVPSHELLNFDADDSFTVMAAVRQWETPVADGLLMHKRDGNVRWSLRPPSTSRTVHFDIGDGSVAVGKTTGTHTAGTMRVAGGVVDRTAQTLLAWDSEAGTTTTTSTTTCGTLVGSTALRIGGQSGYAYADMELFGAAVWRRALTTAEITHLNTAYTTNTFDATALSLLNEATFWMDANLSTSKAAIARSTSGYKSVAVTRPVWLFDGSNDYMEIANHSDLNFDTDDDFTVVAVVRQWPTAADEPYIAKEAGYLAADAGWALSSYLTSSLANIADGAVRPYAMTTLGGGDASMVALVRDHTNDVVKSYVGSTVTSATDTTTAVLGNSSPTYIGRLATTYGDFELLGVAVFRRALDADELALLAAYYEV